MERAGQPVGLEPLVEAVGLLERVGVHEDDRVELGALFVIGLDTGEAALDELAAGEAPSSIASWTEATVASSSTKGFPLWFSHLSSVMALTPSSAACRCRP